jgi:hypothetical protein
MSCPAALLRTETATFAYNGHTMVARLGGCGGVSVTLDSRSLPLLEQTTFFTHDVMHALKHPQS